MRYQYKIVMIGLGLIVTACSRIYGEHGWIKKHPVEYKESVAAQPLVVPDNLSATFHPTYAIPDIQADSEQPATLLPPGSVAPQIQAGEIIVKPIKLGALTAEEIRITPDKDGDIRLQIARPIEFVWYSLGKAIESAGYKLASQDQVISTYFLLDTPTTGKVVRKDTAIYQLQLFAIDEGVDIYLLDENGEPVAEPIAQRIFRDLQQALLHPNRPSWLTRLMKRLDNDRKG